MTATPEARRSIRVFSAAVWVIGALIVATNVGPFISEWSSGYLFAFAAPPEEDDVPVEDYADSVIGKDGQVMGVGPTRIPITPDLDGQALRFTLDHVDSGSSEVTLMLVDPTGEYYAPKYVGFVGLDSPLIFAAYPEYDLMIDATGGWSGHLEAVDLPELSSTATGTSSATYMYRGVATSGTLTVDGPGHVWVTATTFAGLEFLDDDITKPDPDGATRVAQFNWTASPYVVVDIVVIGDLEWTLTMDDEDAP